MNPAILRARRTDAIARATPIRIDPQLVATHAVGNVAVMTYAGKIAAVGLFLACEREGFGGGVVNNIDVAEWFHAALEAA